MAAKVTEVTGFKSVDGEVFDTFLKAHRRNIFCLCHELFATEENDTDYPEYARAAKLLHDRLTLSEDAKTILAQLASELS
jgi:hypothetical protein